MERDPLAGVVGTVADLAGSRAIGQGPLEAGAAGVRVGGRRHSCGVAAASAPERSRALRH